MLVTVDRSGYYSLEKDLVIDVSTASAAVTFRVFLTVFLNNLSQDYSNLDDVLSLTCTDSPGFKPFTL